MWSILTASTRSCSRFLTYAGHVSLSPCVSQKLGSEFPLVVHHFRGLAWFQVEAPARISAQCDTLRGFLVAHQVILIMLTYIGSWSSLWSNCSPWFPFRHTVSTLVGRNNRGMTSVNNIVPKNVYNLRHTRKSTAVFST